jgi:hypothetical protein
VIVATSSCPKLHVTDAGQVLRRAVAVRARRRELLRRPLAIDGLAGVTAIDCSVAAVTVNTSTGDVTPLSSP